MAGALNANLRKKDLVETTDTQILRMSSGEIISINPATMAEVGRAPILSALEVKVAVENARSAQPAWAALSFKERAGYILKAKDLLLGQQRLPAGNPILDPLRQNIRVNFNLLFLKIFPEVHPDNITHLILLAFQLLNFPGIHLTGEK